MFPNQCLCLFLLSWFRFFSQNHCLWCYYSFRNHFFLVILTQKVVQSYHHEYFRIWKLPGKNFTWRSFISLYYLSMFNSAGFWVCADALARWNGNYLYKKRKRHDHGRFYPAHGLCRGYRTDPSGTASLDRSVWIRIHGVRKYHFSSKHADLQENRYLQHGLSGSSTVR